MKLWLKILVGVAIVSGAAVAWLLLYFHGESVRLSNRLRIAPAQAKRWLRVEDEDEDEDDQPPDQAAKVEGENSPGTKSLDSNQNENEKIS
jgi:hypothetical protein